MEFCSAFARRARLRADQTSRVICRSGDAERGFTLIELVVTIGILAVGILSATQIYFGALNVHANVDVRTAAERVASQQLELVRTTQYAAAAMPSAVPIPPTFEGEPIVFSASGQVQPGPEDVTFNSLTFSVQRHVTERTDPAGVPFRRVTIDVTATSEGPGNGIKLRQETAIYQGRGFDVAPPDPPATFAPAAPTAFVAGPPASGDPTSGIDLSWVPTAPLPQFYDIYYSNNSGVTSFLLEKGLDGTLTSWPVRNLAADANYEFSIRARNGNLTSPQRTASRTTNSVFPFPFGCQIGLVSVTPEDNPLSPPDDLSTNIRVSAATNGGCFFGVGITIHTDSGDITSVMSMSDNVARYNFSRFAASWETGPKSIDVFDRLTGTVVARVGFAVSG